MNQVRYVPPRVPLTDPNTGLITTQWYLFLQNLMDPRSGDELQSLVLSTPISNVADYTGPLATALDELAQAPTPEALTVPFAGDLELSPADVPTVIPDDLSPVLALLVAQMAELTKAVEDIRKGTLVL